MFTEAERLRAIELYFKYGRKLAPVVRELGYPSKRNLRRWIRLWEASDGATKAIRRKPRYSDVQKQAAVEHYLNHGCCLAFTSRTLGYPCSDVLARWVNERHPDRRLIFTSTINQNAPFEPEVKHQAVMALSTRHVPAREIAMKIGISRTVCTNGKMKSSAMRLTSPCANMKDRLLRRSATRCAKRLPDSIRRYADSRWSSIS